MIASAIRSQGQCSLAPLLPRVKSHSRPGTDGRFREHREGRGEKGGGRNPDFRFRPCYNVLIRLRREQTAFEKDSSVGRFVEPSSPLMQYIVVRALPFPPSVCTGKVKLQRHGTQGAVEDDRGRGLNDTKKGEITGY